MEWTQDKIEKIYQEIRKAGMALDRAADSDAISDAAWSEFLEGLGIKKTIILWDEDFIFPPDDKICASDEAFVTIFFDKNFNRGEKVHLKIPIETAEKILVLGL